MKRIIVLYLVFTVPGLILLLNNGQSFKALGIEMIGSGISFLLVYYLVQTYQDKREEDILQKLFEIEKSVLKDEEKNQELLQKATNGKPAYHIFFSLFAAGIICGAALGKFVIGAK